MTITIRSAEPSDRDALVAFNQAIARETEDRELNEQTLRYGISALLADEHLGFYLVAEDAGRVIGCVMITREWSDWRNGVFWWVQSVYVDAEYRRQGVYRRLYQHVHSLAKDHNVCGFRLYVERDNTIAQQTYTNLGMNETPYRMFEQEVTQSENASEKRGLAPC